jgi:hypothetical protein
VCLLHPEELAAQLGREDHGDPLPRQPTKLDGPA